MFSHLKRALGPACLAFIMLLSPESMLNAKAADKDDHSYLPPSMRNERVVLAKADQRAEASQPSDREKRAEKPEAGSSTEQKAAPKTDTGLRAYVTNLFRRSIKFAFGD